MKREYISMTTSIFIYSYRKGINDGFLQQHQFVLYVYMGKKYKLKKISPALMYYGVHAPHCPVPMLKNGTQSALSICISSRETENRLKALIKFLCMKKRCEHKKKQFLLNRASNQKLNGWKRVNKYLASVLKTLISSLSLRRYLHIMVFFNWLHCFISTYDKEKGRSNECYGILFINIACYRKQGDNFFFPLHLSLLLKIIFH